MFIFKTHPRQMLIKNWNNNITKMQISVLEQNLSGTKCDLMVNCLIPYFLAFVYLSLYLHLKLNKTCPYTL